MNETQLLFGGNTLTEIIVKVTDDHMAKAGFEIENEQERARLYGVS